MMKKIILTLFTILFTSSTGLAGDKAGNGGNSVALEFKSISYDILYYLEQIPQKKRNDFFEKEVSLKDFRNTIEEMKLVTVEKLTSDKNGSTYLTAKNYPAQKLIEISYLQWMKETQKPSIVLHEILGLMNLDYDFSISRKFKDASFNATQSFLRGFLYFIKKVSPPSTSSAPIQYRNYNFFDPFHHINSNADTVFIDIKNISIAQFKEMLFKDLYYIYYQKKQPSRHLRSFIENYKIKFINSSFDFALSAYIHKHGKIKYKKIKQEKVKHIYTKKLGEVFHFKKINMPIFKLSTPF